MPWEEDEELKDAPPMVLLNFFGTSLNMKQKARLTELALEQLQQEKQELCDKLIVLKKENNDKTKENSRLKIKQNLKEQPEKRVTRSSKTNVTAENPDSSESKKHDLSPTKPVSNKRSRINSPVVRAFSVTCNVIPCWSC